MTIVDDRNEPVGLIRDDDALSMYNYRADRAREITMALTDRNARAAVPVARAEESDVRDDDAVRQELSSLPYVLPPEHPDNILADVMAQANWKNLRVAETEKYAHVTYFFNGGNEKPYAGRRARDGGLPKVATYDLKPEMSAAGVTETWCRRSSRAAST